MQSASHDRLMNLWLEEERVDLRSAGGRGAGSFLLPPTEESHLMPDAHFLVAMRRRLRVPHAAALNQTPLNQVASSNTCQHRSVESGVACGCELDAEHVYPAHICVLYFLF